MRLLVVSFITITDVVSVDGHSSRIIFLLVLRGLETVAPLDVVCSSTHSETSARFVLFLILFLMIFTSSFLCLFMMGQGHVPQLTPGDQRTTCGGHFSPFALWDEIQDLASRQVPSLTEPSRQFPPHCFSEIYFDFIIYIYIIILII